MNVTGPGSRLRAWHCIAATLLAAFFMGVFVVWGFFRLSSESEALRESLMGSVQGKWDKKIGLHVGVFSTALVRAGSRFFEMPPEPRAALEAIRSVEFGIYELREDPGPIDAGAILARADKAMSGRGWQRAVGVVHEHQVVAVYLPRREVRLGSLKCCLLVLESRNLVVLSAKGNLEPLVELAWSKLGPEWREHRPGLFSIQDECRSKSSANGSNAKLVASNIP
jgi:hypothetical protein